MYSVVSAIGVKNGIGQKWEQINIQINKVIFLFEKYRRVYITVSPPSSLDKKFVDMNTLREKYSLFPGSLQDMFIDIGDNNLVTLENEPKINNKTILYSDSRRAMYNINAYHRLYGINVHIDDRIDALLYKQGIDYKHFYENCLVTVNGLLHLIDYSENGIIVIDAMKSVKLAKQNQMGIINFSRVGEIKQIPITENMLVRKPLQTDNTKNQPLSEAIYIKLEQDVVGKTVMLSLGGYLITHMSNSFQPVGDNLYKIDIQNYPFIDRIMESKLFLDFSSFGLTTNPNNINHYNKSELISDNFITKYITMSQSFVIVVDNPDIYVDRQFVKKDAFPGRFISYSEPKLPLMTYDNRLPEYWPICENGVWSLNVVNSDRRNYYFDTMKSTYVQDQDLNITDSVMSTNKANKKDAFLLEIGSDMLL